MTYSTKLKKNVSDGVTESHAKVSPKVSPIEILKRKRARYFYLTL